MPLGDAHDDRDDGGPGAAAGSRGIRGRSILSAARYSTFAFAICTKNPWERMRIVSSWMKETPLIVMTRSQSLFTFEFFPDDIVALTCGADFRERHPLSHAI